MLKNFIKLFFILILVLSLGNKAFSYGLDFDNKGFYSSISDNLGKLGSDMYSIELENNGGVNKKITEKSGLNCIDRDLSEAEVRDIVIKGDVSGLTASLNQNCRDEEGNIDSGKLRILLNAISSVYVDSQNSARSKSEKTMGFSNVGIYADGIAENGPFDLYKDFEDIDKIIFEHEEKDDYPAEKVVDLSKKVKELINKLAKGNKNSSNKSQNNNSNSSNQSQNNSSGNSSSGVSSGLANIFQNNTGANSNPTSNNSVNNTKNNNSKKEDDSIKHRNLCDLSGKCDNYTEVQKMLCQSNGGCSGEEKGFLATKNEFVCKKDDSGLNTVSGKIISNTLANEKDTDEDEEEEEDNSNNSGNSNSQNSANKNTNSSNSGGKSSKSSKGGKSSGGKSGQTAPDPKQDYKKLNDNKVFPCNNFFCIDIEFKTIAGGFGSGGDPSIEFLVKRSNKHLKKFVNSSLSQAKMSINNFELSLKDLQLPDMFHLGFQISYEPVPMLYLNKDLTTGEDKETNQDDQELKLQSQLEKYYKANGMDYNMRNDLSSFNQIERKSQATFNSSAGSADEMRQKIEQLKEYQDKSLSELDSLRTTVEEKVRYEMNGDIERQMKEVERFNRAMNDYITNLEAILNEMIKIPVDRSMT
ncbi:hypothetical protein HG430_000070 [Candidatus Gracilibacteria bacterium]|nr:hypothetical protein [Candidatus Gracilibacteria bacterium]